jgi:hypothetical protein
MDMDVMDVDPPVVRIWPVQEQGLSPALMWDDMVPGLASTEGGVLACPWCGLCPNLHLGGIYYATPAPERYWPSFGVDIDVLAAVVTFPGVEATRMRGGDDGVMLAIEVWCDNGCRGRIEFRQHKDVEEDVDVVRLNLVELPGFPLDDVDPDDDGGPVAAGDVDATEPPW